MKRILIVGAGFAAMHAALSAARLRDEQGVSPDTLGIAVVAPEPRLVVRPRLYERAPETMVAPLAELFDAVDIRYEQGRVDVIDSASKSVVIVGPDGMRRSLRYDRLVLAAGSQGFKPDIPGLAKYGFTVDQLDDAIALDHHLNALANRPSSAARNTAVVCGGGFTGIEVATEMPSRLRAILGPKANVRVIIVDRNEAIAPAMGPHPRPLIEKALREAGVETRLGVGVSAPSESGVTLSDGQSIESATVIWAGGFRASPLTAQVPAERDRSGRLVVRIGDERIIRLVRKWLKAGVLEDGEWSVSEEGTPQGAVASPLLANVYLHYVFDLWAERWRRREAKGNIIILRYADDIIVGFQHEADARRFWEAMRLRFEQFSLALHPEKTRLLEFGRKAAATCKRRRLGKPETFTFLGFIFICGKSRRGAFQLQRKTRRDRMRAKLREIKGQLRERMHEPIPEQGRWLKQVVTGFFAYHAVPTNPQALSAFRHYVTDLWRRTLRRRSQKDGMTWARITKIADAWLPKPRILHLWPDQRFAVTHPRWEPSA